MKRLMVRYSIVMLAMLAGRWDLYGQIYPQTAFYWENPYYINPAAITPDQMALFTVAARKQWLGLQGTPATFLASGVVYLKNYHTQAGVRITKDRIGYINTLDVSVSYAYALRIRRNSILNLGLSGTYQSQHIKREDVVADNPADPIFQNERFKGVRTGDAGIGAEYVYSGSLVAGVACQNLFSFFREKESNIWEGVNHLYIRYRMKSAGRQIGAYDVEYGVCARQCQDEVQVDGLISLYLNRNRQQENLQFSLCGRSVGEIGVLIGVKLVSGLKFLGSYSYNFNVAIPNAYGNFEVMVSYPIRSRNICRNSWGQF